MNFSIVIVFLGYLLGSFPTSYLAGRIISGIDLREHGSGNLGATNTLRVLGKVPGITVLIIDILKGAMAVYIVTWLVKDAPLYYQVLSGMLAIIGHNWSIFLQFSGGKGVATSSGVLLALTPKITLILLVIFITSLLLSKYVSLSSLIAAVTYPILTIYLQKDISIIIFAVTVATLITFRHKANIRRLIAGNENKINFGKSEEKVK